MKKLEVINDLRADERRWFAVRTKFKCEKYVAEHIRRKGIEVYLPLLTQVKQYSSRKKVYKVPLINSFVFVYIRQDEYVKVLETEYVYGLLRQRRDLLHIPEHEIELIRKIVGDFNEVRIEDYDFTGGEEVEVISGQLTGLKGRVFERKGKEVFAIQLYSLGMQMLITINKKDLRPVKSLKV